MWDQLWLWFNQAKRDALTEGKLGADDAIRFQTIMEELVGLNFEKAQKELEMLQTLTEAAKSPVVFCHNDALADNILVVEETDVLLIDFEYGGCNYRGFDIANHWNEWAGGTQASMNGVPDYRDFPSQEEQLAFCQAYIGACGKADTTCLPPPVVTLSPSDTATLPPCLSCLPVG